MACKRGIRKSLEASRAYYDSLKAYDPARELWTFLVKRSSDDRGLASLSKEERVYFAINLLEKEVYNGGFDQYFFNSSSDYNWIAVEGLREIRALQSLKLVREAANTLFGRDGPPADQADRWRIMSSKAPHLSQQHRRESHLDRLDKEFYKDPDQLGERLTAYAKQHGLVSRCERGTH
ncbi:DUF4375 domain-containing protein [Hansschlegelia zhihuaiae]|uniref:DUF4375 domain-containing protein n=2 Tax=Hansschlegelia zhihuaiae TaxID=405005 RepID=A0A4Q0MJK7_9HYPH|nr:DMP19 family protein [Hansschlegelia zhihuaiae]RXF73760.1 DUF4375 domain-containing protein [Hansschlegelia zhihuaiae]